jgi:hypothetical protein
MPAGSPFQLPAHDKEATRARAVWTDPATGKRRFVLLPGAFDSPESREAYRRLLAEIDATPAAPVAPVTGPGLSVSEVLLPFLTHAEQHYRGADGQLTSEYREYRLIVRTLRELYGHTPTVEFGPLALKAVRQT